jgi:hypothetical protein
MVKRMSIGLLIAALALASLPTAVTAQDSEGVPALSDLEPNVWSMLSPGGDTICATGTPYGFFVRPANPDKLLVILGGGGICWSFETCDLKSSPTYQPFVGTVNNMASLGGVLDMDNPENPFGEYSIVFIPTCTADNHLGNRETTYQPAVSSAEAQERTIYHNGFVNAMTVLDWTYANFDTPTRIFILGISAGAVASPFYGGLVAEQYPDAQIAVLGDSAGGFQLRAEQSAVVDGWGTVKILPDWPEYEGVTAETLSSTKLYIASATRFPNVVFAQYNSAHDESQNFFLNLLGITDTPLSELLKASHTEIRDAVPGNFFSYTAEGTMHVISSRPQFYTKEVNGVRFVDWIAALAAGEAIEDVLCTDC